MKFYLTTVLALLPLALAAQFKSVIVTFSKETPSWVVEQAKDDLRNSGGVITHNYNLLNGFAADAPVDALQTLSTQSTQYKPEIEDDKVVSAYGN